MIRYRECQRNHAAHSGGHVLDGCGEFMPAGEDGTTEALKCAACSCHRNFHRREADGDTTTTSMRPPLLLPPPPSTANCYISFTGTTPTLKPQKNPTIRPLTLPPHLQHHYHPPRAPVMVALGGGAAAESSSEDRAGNFAVGADGVLKKRFRTKFTAEQKEKMAEFAERIGWRILKQNEGEVQSFCEEVGIRRQVFKVWLHNNKQGKAIKRSNNQS